MFRTLSDPPPLWECLLAPELLWLPGDLTQVDALLGVPALFAPLAAPRIEKQALVTSPTDSRAGNVIWLLSVGGRAYAGRNGDL